VAGLIGGGDRFDHTVAGDSVNIAARLCAAAREGEVIADCQTAGQAETASFGPEETLQVKGRTGNLCVRKLSVKQAPAPVLPPA
jgi:adenylate cyclase